MTRGAAVRRVAIVGSPGSGKSTLAEAWGRITGLPVVHLDLLVWKPSWVFTGPQELEFLHGEAVGKPQWIIEGYIAPPLLQRTLAAAAQIVFLETPHEICIERARQRMEAQKKTPDRFTQKDCSYEEIWEGHLEFIAEFQKTQGPLLRGLLQGEFAATPQVVLDGRLSVDALCATLKALG